MSMIIQIICAEHHSQTDGNMAIRLPDEDTTHSKEDVDKLRDYLELHWACMLTMCSRKVDDGKV